MLSCRRMTGEFMTHLTASYAYCLLPISFSPCRQICAKRMRQNDIDRPLNHNRFLAVLAFRHPRLGKNSPAILTRVPFAIWTKIFEYVGERDCWTYATLSEEERARLRTPLVQTVARATEVCEDWPAYEARVFKGARGRLSDREQCMRKNWETKVILR